jgi:hypothetical protein
MLQLLGFRWSVLNGSGIKWLYDREASVNKIETARKRIVNSRFLKQMEFPS